MQGFLLLLDMNHKQWKTFRAKRWTKPLVRLFFRVSHEVEPRTRPAADSINFYSCQKYNSNNSSVMSAFCHTNVINIPSNVAADCFSPFTGKWMFGLGKICIGPMPAKSLHSPHYMNLEIRFARKGSPVRSWFWWHEWRKYSTCLCSVAFISLLLCLVFQSTLSAKGILSNKIQSRSQGFKWFHSLFATSRVMSIWLPGRATATECAQLAGVPQDWRNRRAISVSESFLSHRDNSSTSTPMYLSSSNGSYLPITKTPGKEKAEHFHLKLYFWEHHMSSCFRHIPMRGSQSASISARQEWCLAFVVWKLLFHYEEWTHHSPGNHLLPIV